MSFKGQIEAKCPKKGCEPFEAEVWSFIRGDSSPELRDAVLWRELNLLLCPECSAAFFPDASYVYFEPDSDLLAFVFPESFRKEEEYWRGKMREDFVTMKTSIGGQLALVVEPEIYFGQEDIAEALEREDFRGEEREVMEAVAKELELPLYRVAPGFSRRESVPRSLPYEPAKKGGAATREAVIAGLEKLLAANDRLDEYKKYLARLKAEKAAALPPAAKAA
jgi:hypothetical protein